MRAILVPIIQSLAIALALPGATRAANAAPPPSPASAIAASDLNGHWSELPPPQRRNHSAIYDPVRDRIVVFGGFSITYRREVWVLEPGAEPAWTEITPAGGPDARRFHSAIYDPNGDRMIVFGGRRSPDGGNDYSTNEVWALSLSGTPTWTELTPSGTPPEERFGQSAVYDSVGKRMIVFGGVGATVLGDVWALSLDGSPAWTDITPSGGPGVREGHSAIYDPVRQQMVIYGGYDNSTNRSDVWSLSLSGSPTWTRIFATGNSAGQFLHSAIYDPLGDRMLAFGINDGNDVWALPLTGSPVWGTLSPTGGPPSARTEHAAIYDASRHSMVIVGGLGHPPIEPHPTSTLGDTWELTLGGPPSWSKVAGLDTLPRFRSGQTSVYDPVRDRMIVFGGFDQDAGGTYMNDVWALSLSGAPIWTPLAPTGTPPTGRYRHTAIYDPVRDRMIVFAGRDDPFPYDDLSDVWALSLGAAPAWTQLAPSGTSPGMRSGHTAIYDPVRDRMIVYAGFSYPDNVGDVWALSLAGSPAWTLLAPAGTPPDPRHEHDAIYDPVRDRMVIYGGVNEPNPTFDDAWALSLGSSPQWTLLTPTGSPPARSEQPAIYDPVRDRMIVLGGPGGSLAYFDDPRALSLAGGTSWALLSPVGLSTYRRFDESAIYDPVRDRIVVFGGKESGVVFSSDTWSLSFDEPLAASADCGGDAIWTVGVTNDLYYRVHNPDGFAQIADYRLTSERNWPGFPITGSFSVAAGVTDSALIGVPVPDSAANGLNVLRFQATLRTALRAVYCDHHIHDASTPTQLALVVAEADPDRVRLTWHAASGTPEATVERTEAGGSWSAVGSIAADGNGDLHFEDRDVIAGHRYGYRLGVREGGTLMYAGEAWVDVPLTVAFELRGARPNPATSDLRVSLSLAATAPARLELIDIAGRRVRTLALPAGAAGSRTVRLAEGGALAPGIYVVRLTQQSRTATARVVITR